MGRRARILSTKVLMMQEMMKKTSSELKNVVAQLEKQGNKGKKLMESREQKEDQLIQEVVERIDEGEQRTIARAHTSSSNGEDRKVITSPKLSWADEIEAMEVDVPKVRKFLSILLKRWDSKVNAITEAKDLNKMVMDELIGNPKTYEMLKKLRKLKDEPKAEKYLVLNAAKDIPSAEDK
ncbi:hypothetical protein FXO37_21770 [Capsicum annuum]|nr:hypothetical protein FXO37_21770 [Capsicum annuum]